MADGSANTRPPEQTSSMSPFGTPTPFPPQRFLQEASPTPTQVSLDDLDTLLLLRQATARHDAMKTVPTAYRKTTLRMQDVGLLGEHALLFWLGQHHDRVDHIAETENMRTAGDVALVRSNNGITDWASVTFEVKTSRYEDWRAYGRTLDAAQLARCGAHAYVWAVVSNEWPTPSILLMGWLPIDDVRKSDNGVSCVVHRRPHWRVITPMRPMDELPKWWTEVPHTSDSIW